MFTGIISDLGEVVEVRPNALGIQIGETIKKLALGGSVAVNGACLTVVQVEADMFFADVIPETLQRTNLGRLQIGDKVNLELPLQLHQGLDGHLVQGHVDAVSKVLAVSEVTVGREVTFELPPELSPYVAEKGSIAVDGVSLTVIQVQEGSFRVGLIPYTFQATIAGAYEVGQLVNLEVDVIARYVERLVMSHNQYAIS